jgi:hypothetical protein
MLRVTIELLPHGDERRKQHLGTMEIINNGEGTLEDGSYSITLSKWGKPKSVWKRAFVKSFPRMKLGPWDLMFRALLQAVGYRNKSTAEEI